MLRSLSTSLSLKRTPRPGLWLPDPSLTCPSLMPADACIKKRQPWVTSGSRACMYGAPASWHVGFVPYTLPASHCSAASCSPRTHLSQEALAGGEDPAPPWAAYLFLLLLGALAVLTRAWRVLLYADLRHFAGLHAAKCSLGRGLARGDQARQQACLQHLTQPTMRRSHLLQLCGEGPIRVWK